MTNTAVATISGSVGSILYALVDGIDIHPVFNVVLVDFFLKACQTAVFGGIGAISGLIAKEIYPLLAKPIKAWLQRKFNNLKNKLK